MPELPEVETVRRSLLTRLPGRTVTEIRVRDARLRVPVAEAQLHELIAGQRVTELSRRAKYLIIHFDNRSRLIVHLGMSGQLLLVSADVPFDKHDHVIFSLDGGLELRFRDPRRFGMVVALAESELSDYAPLRRLGPEPLAADFTPDYLFARSRGSKKPVKNFLMDQQVIVGVGNIYASESLFLAGIHPLRPAGQISRERWRRLTMAVRRVLRNAIRQGGTTLSDFRDSQGNAGYFQTALRVYGRKGEPCRTCRTSIRAQVIAGRSTFFCPRCQR
ncbi:MAG TPA: bifunctional DNA-formamidopyrimidine glycosylase/DNA-(apurinic or apyrimidinic site) lyase [Blastocatellia bacterium]|nr:bifunctional DNA-formamidopyrimidine glycosylase/DNA-(apurinic or apyrimidinic site) lyase [Blastocatellia bacterium]